MIYCEQEKVSDPVYKKEPIIMKPSYFGTEASYLPPGHYLRAKANEVPSVHPAFEPWKGGSTKKVRLEKCTTSWFMTISCQSNTLTVSCRQSLSMHISAPAKLQVNKKTPTTNKNKTKRQGKKKKITIVQPPKPPERQHEKNFTTKHSRSSVVIVL